MMNRYIYVIWDKANETFVKWGQRPDSQEGYCLYRGQPMFFTSWSEAYDTVRQFNSGEGFGKPSCEHVVVKYRMEGIC